MDESDFVNIEMTNIKGKSMLKITDPESPKYIDPTNGHTFDHLSDSDDDDNIPPSKNSSMSSSSMSSSSEPSSSESSSSESLSDNEGESEVEGIQEHIIKTPPQIIEIKEIDENDSFQKIERKEEEEPANQYDSGCIGEAKDSLLKRRIIRIKEMFDLPITQLPMLTAIIMEALDNIDIDGYLLTGELKYVYANCLLNWINDDLYNRLYVGDTKTLYQSIAQNLIEAIIQISQNKLEYSAHCIVPSTDELTEFLVKGGYLKDSKNAFDLTLNVIRIVNHLDMYGYQKKLYVMNVLDRVREREMLTEIFGHKDDQDKFWAAYHFLPSFIDVVIAIDKGYYRINDKPWYNSTKEWLKTKLENTGCMSFSLKKYWNKVKRI